MQVRRVHHVGIAVSDYAEADRLVSGILGFEKVRDVRTPTGGIGAFYRVGDFELEIVQPGPSVWDSRLEGARARIDHLALQVDDLDATMSALADAGITGTEETFATGRSLRTEKATTAGFTLQFVEPPGHGAVSHPADPLHDPSAEDPLALHPGEEPKLTGE